MTMHLPRRLACEKSFIRNGREHLRILNDYLGDLQSPSWRCNFISFEDVGQRLDGLLRLESLLRRPGQTREAFPKLSNLSGN